MAVVLLGIGRRSLFLMFFAHHHQAGNNHLHTLRRLVEVRTQNLAVCPALLQLSTVTVIPLNFLAAAAVAEHEICQLEPAVTYYLLQTKEPENWRKA